MKDILDLCRLNLIEETVKDSHAVDREATLKAIDWTRRQTMTRIIRTQVPATEEVMKRHQEQNLIEEDDVSDFEE